MKARLPAQDPCLPSARCPLPAGRPQRRRGGPAALWPKSRPRGRPFGPGSHKLDHLISTAVRCQACFEGTFEPAFGPQNTGLRAEDSGRRHEPPPFGRPPANFRPTASSRRPAGKRTVLRLGPVLWDVAYACSLRIGPMTPTGHKASVRRKARQQPQEIFIFVEIEKNNKII